MSLSQVGGTPPLTPFNRYQFPPPKLLTEEDEEEDVVMREDSDLTWDPTIDEIYRTMPAEQAAM